MRTTTELSGPEYDNLVVQRTTHILSPSDSSLVTHLIFALSQRRSGDGAAVHFVKVVRLGVLGEEIVPTNQDVVSSQRDMLTALRARGLSCLAVMARLPDQPFLFAWGVEGVASTQEEATRLADAAWDILSTQMLGAHSRFILPISVTQLAALDTASETWSQVSMVRGHPDPSTGDQLETFLSAADEEFVLTLVASPLNSANMALARSIARRDFDMGITGLGVDYEDELRRCDEGLEYGALLYQMFVLTRSPATMSGVSEKLTDAFWTSNAPHMLSVVESSGVSEAQRLRVHAATFTSDLRPGLSLHATHNVEFSTYITLNELAAMAHPTSLKSED